MGVFEQGRGVRRKSESTHGVPVIWSKGCQSVQEEGVEEMRVTVCTYIVTIECVLVHLRLLFYCFERGVDAAVDPCSSHESDNDWGDAE